MSAESADGGMSELNSLYAVVQEIKKDLSHMSKPGSRNPSAAPSAASAAAHPVPQEPSTHAPDLLDSRARGKPGVQEGEAGKRRTGGGAQGIRVELPEPDEAQVGARAGSSGGARAADASAPRFAATRSQVTGGGRGVERGARWLGRCVKIFFGAAFGRI